MAWYTAGAPRANRLVVAGHTAPRVMAALTFRITHDRDSRILLVTGARRLVKRWIVLALTGQCGHAGGVVTVGGGSGCQRKLDELSLIRD
jgi:hypothetical protein